VGWFVLVLGLLFLGFGYVRDRKKQVAIPSYMFGGVLVVIGVLAIAGLMNRQ
jgi:allophanate hydrolase subunit 1